MPACKVHEQERLCSDEGRMKVKVQVRAPGALVTGAHIGCLSLAIIAL